MKETAQIAPRNLQANLCLINKIEFDMIYMPLLREKGSLSCSSIIIIILHTLIMLYINY